MTILQQRRILQIDEWLGIALCTLLYVVHVLVVHLDAFPWVLGAFLIATYPIGYGSLWWRQWQEASRNRWRFASGAPVTRDAIRILEEHHGDLEKRLTTLRESHRALEARHMALRGALRRLGTEAGISPDVDAEHLERDIVERLRSIARSR